MIFTNRIRITAKRLIVGAAVRGIIPLATADRIIGRFLREV